MFTVIMVIIHIHISGTYAVRVDEWMNFYS